MSKKGGPKEANLFNWPLILVVGALLAPAGAGLGSGRQAYNRPLQRIPLLEVNSIAQELQLSMKYDLGRSYRF